MYSACIHCARSLGSNQALEAFPVGTRLAFDPKKGRLWVVCRQCERWNLSPLDERWEAIEQAERRFRDARLRVSTDQIGLARLREGLDLIRIGDPQRPEMAAWRYGDQFGRRRRRHLFTTAAAVGAGASIVGGALWVGMSGILLYQVLGSGRLWRTLVNGSPDKIVARARDEAGNMLVIQRKHVGSSAIQRSSDGGPFSLLVSHAGGSQLVHGEHATRIASQLLPVANRFGGSRKQVQDAVSLLEDAGSAGALISNVQDTFGAGSVRAMAAAARLHNPQILLRVAGTLNAIPARERLALEMALHEESERRAMDGELDQLTRAWRDAEEIAAIADDMFVTQRVQERIAELRDGRK